MATTLTEPETVEAPARVKRRLWPSSKQTASSPNEKPPVKQWSVGVVTGVIAATLGLSLIAFIAFLAWGSQVQEGRTQAGLYDDFRQELREATAPVQAPIAAGAPVALLNIPKIALDQVVVQGATSRDMTNGPGHRTDTVLPGQTGASVIYGHRSAFGAPFKNLVQLSIGDQIIATTGQGKFTYEIDNMRFSDQRVELPEAVASRLVLVTSDPAWHPGRSLIVSAALQGKPQPAALVGAAIPSEQPLARDLSAGLPTLLWAQALLLVVLASTWAWFRYSRPVLWIAIGPLLLLISWNLFENLSALLPNTL